MPRMRVIGLLNHRIIELLKRQESGAEANRQ